MAERAFALRLDVLSEADKENLSKWLTKEASSFFVVKEEANPNENTHYHAVFYASSKTASLRQSFRRAFPNHKGNAAYSLKECDDDVDAYGRYMCKGVSRDVLPEVVCRQGLHYTDEWVRESHDEYWVNNDALKKNKLRRKMNVVETLEDICKEKKIRWTDRNGIATEYVRHYVAARKPINSFAARAVVNTVAVLLDDTGEAVEQLATEIAGRF